MWSSLDEWKPMDDDFKSISFNSYSRGPGLHLPLEMLPSFHSNNKFSLKPSLHKRHNLKLFIEGFSSELTESGLKTFLEGIGCKPLRVKIVHSKTRLGRPFSFVDFESGKEATKAIELIDKQNIYKLFVSFAPTELDKEKKQLLISREKNSFAEQMKNKISLENASISRSSVNPISPTASDNGGGDTKINEVMTSLAASNKLLKILQVPDAECSFCNDSPKVDHLHFILSENLVVDPKEFPELIDFNVSCLTCGAKDSNLKLCSQCKIATYCSRRCQASSWSEHSQNCRPSQNAIQHFNSIDSERFLNSVSQKQLETNSRIEVKSNANQLGFKSVQTPNVVNSRETLKDLTIDLNLGLKEKLNEKSNVPKEPKESPFQVSNDSIRVNRSPNLEKSNTSATNVKTDQINLNKMKHKIDQSRSDLLSEEITDGEEDLVICFGRDPSDFYLQKSSNIDTIALLIEKLNEKVKDFPQLADKDLRIGSLCGGIYSDDKWCYRARIVGKVDENTYALNFIDYGNTEPVSTGDIKALPSNFFDFKAQAIHCSLNVLVPTNGSWDESAKSFFEELGGSQTYTKVRIFERTKEGIYKIDLFNHKGESIIDQMIKNKFGWIPRSNNSEILEAFASRTSDKSVRSPGISPQVSPKKKEVIPQSSPKVIFNKSSVNNLDIERSIRGKAKQSYSNDSDSSVESVTTEVESYLDSLETNSEVSVMITEPFNIDEFEYWGILNPAKYSRMSEKLRSEYSTSAVKCTPRKGDIVVVKASDNDYYRSYVLDVENGVANVLMFDAGINEKVTDVYKMNSKYCKIPALSVLLMPKTKPQKVLLELIATKETPEFEGIFVRANNDKKCIKIGEEMVDVLGYKSGIDLLLEKDESPKVAETVDFYSQLPALKLEMNKQQEVLVVFQDEEDPDVFFAAGTYDDFQYVMSQCTIFGSKFDKSVKPTVGNAYLVKHSDGEWYRAIVTNVEPGKCKVLFIDFGNIDEISNKHVMNLPPNLQLSSLPAVAVKCKVSSSDLKKEDLHKKIEKAVDATYLLKIEPVKYEDSIHYVNVY